MVCTVTHKLFSRGNVAFIYCTWPSIHSLPWLFIKTTVETNTYKLKTLKLLYKTFSQTFTTFVMLHEVFSYYPEKTSTAESSNLCREHINTGLPFISIIYHLTSVRGESTYIHTYTDFLWAGIRKPSTMLEQSKPVREHWRANWLSVYNQ